MGTSTIDPASMAQQLATAYVSGTQTLLSNQSTQAQTTSTALTKLQSALSAFSSALSGLTTKKSVLSYTASLSSSGYATATASATATAGSTSVFVEQVASANQVAFEDLPAVPVVLGGPLVVQLADGSNFSVNLAGADQDGDGTLSQTEIARAINQASGNNGLVSAMVVTSGSQTNLVLSAGKTGAGSAITLDTSGLPAGTLKDALSTGGKQLAAAQDAVMWLGAQGTGVKVQQASNTFTAIAGVSLTVTQAQAAGSSPMTLSVASDQSGTAGNVQKFIDAYNALDTALDSLTAISSSTSNGSTTTSAGAFANDSSVRALRSSLSNILRQQVGGQRLMDYGITADRNGQLSLDQTQLQKALTAKPDGLDAILGSASTTSPSGVMGSFSTLIKQWTNSTNGLIKGRQDAVQRQQTSITARQTKLEDQYNLMYQRYLTQFTQLQTLQSSMSDNSSLLSSLS